MKMAYNSRVQLGVICLALTSTLSVLACHATSHNSLSRIRPYARLADNACIDRANLYSYEDDSTKSILRHVNLQIRGGAEADRYEYDDRPRRRPPHPNERGGRAMRGDAPEHREGRGQRPPRDFDDHRRYDSRPDDRRAMRDSDRWGGGRDRRTDNTPENNAKKGWFSSKKNQEPEMQQQPQKQQQPPPPPPPPSTFADYNPAETERVPINYMFPSAEVAASERSRDETTNDLDPMGGPDLPIEDADDQYIRSEESHERRRRRSDDDNRYASPRRDAVTMYMSTRLGAAKVRVGSIIVGAALGSFIGKVRTSGACLCTTKTITNMMHLSSVLNERRSENVSYNGWSIILRGLSTK